MRVGTILRILGFIIFLAGVLGGFLIGSGAQSIITAFSSGTYGNTSASGFGWAAAIIAWVSSSILSGLIYAVGAMSNNLDDMNAKLENVQNSALETANVLRHIAHVVDKRLVKDASYRESNGAEPNEQFAPRSNMQSKTNSTQV